MWISCFMQPGPDYWPYPVNGKTFTWLPWLRSNSGLVCRGCHKTKSFIITSCLKFDTFLFALVCSCEQDMTICAACAPPGGGRNPVTPRFLRHFSMFSIPSSAEHTLKHIFKVMKSYLSSMSLDVPFLHFIPWPIHRFAYFLFSFLRSPTLPASQYFLPSLHLFIYSHNHWLIDSFTYSLIFFLPSSSFPSLPLFSTPSPLPPPSPSFSFPSGMCSPFLSLSSKTKPYYKWLTFSY